MVSRLIHCVGGLERGIDTPTHPYNPAFPLIFALPAVQGGALLHSGVLVALTECTFESNTAGEDGLAVMSLGMVNNITDLTFRNNSFFCASGKYGLEKNSDEVEVIPFPTRCTNSSQRI